MAEMGILALTDIEHERGGVEAKAKRPESRPREVRILRSKGYCARAGTPCGVAHRVGWQVLLLRQGPSFGITLIGHEDKARATSIYVHEIVAGTHTERVRGGRRVTAVLHVHTVSVTCVGVDLPCCR